jgi:hypothetical protein
MKRGMFCLALGLGLMVAGSVRADIAYQYVTSQNLYVGSVGQSVTINVYLQETVSGGSSLIANNGGLGAFGIYVNSITNSGVGNSAVINNPSSLAVFSPYGSGGATSGNSFNTSQQFSDNKDDLGSLPSNSFDFGAYPTTNAKPATKNTTTGAALNNGSGAATNEVFVGSFSVSLTKLGLTTFSLTDIEALNGITDDAYAGATATFGGGGLDLSDSGLVVGQNIIGSADKTITFNVNAIPEPTSLMLCGLAFCGMGFRVWIGRKPKTTLPAATTA